MPVPNPSLKYSVRIWPVQPGNLQGQSQPQIFAAFTTEYYVLTSVIAEAIIEWNIGVPVSNQIRQTAADRTDFAY